MKKATAVIRASRRVEEERGRRVYSASLPFLEEMDELRSDRGEEIVDMPHSPIFVSLEEFLTAVERQEGLRQ
jgi:hypothetical protein